MSSLFSEHTINDNFNQKIEIKTTTKKGRGVFAKKCFTKDELIESCQIIPFSSDDADKIELTILSNYWFAWKTDEVPSEYGAICLGNGSLYNHSNHPNAHVFKDYDHNLIHFIASEDIQVGTEITIKYGTIWFQEEEEEEEEIN